jgi:hypothetical protein
MPHQVQLTRFVSAPVEFLSRRKMIVDVDLRNSYSSASLKLKIDISEEHLPPAVRGLKLPGAGGWVDCL